jgi:hypothetical protein
MCFSASADLTAGIVIGALGIDALHHVRHPAERALAALPVLLAAHQLIETFVWWGLEGRVPSPLWHGALWLYLAIAFGVLPVLVPVAVGALEPVVNQRRVGVFAVLGVGVAGALMYAVVKGPIEASIEGHSISYQVGLQHGGLIVALYVAATCGAALVSRHRHVQWFGLANLLAAGLLAWLYKDGLISLWCAWAAVTSLAIVVHLRFADRPRHPVEAAVE